MEWIRLDPLFAWTLRAALAALFATAATHKIRDHRDFLRTFSEYQVVPAWMIGPCGILLIAAEASIAMALLADPTSAIAGRAAAALLLIYSAGILVNLHRGRREIDCGCLGPAHRQPLSAWLVHRNLVLVASALAASLPMSERSLTVIDGVGLLGGFVTLMLLFEAVTGLAAQTWLRPERERIS